jgi:hypothetical protein
MKPGTGGQNKMRNARKTTKGRVGPFPKAVSLTSFVNESQ